MSSLKKALVFALAVSVSVAAYETPAAQLGVSSDGSCGNGTSCTGSPFGGCCSADGQCGS
jgi:hypothetical protein